MLAWQTHGWAWGGLLTMGVPWECFKEEADMIRSCWLSCGACFWFFCITAFLRYNSRITQITHFKCVIRWILVYGVGPPSPKSILGHFHWPEEEGILISSCRCFLWLVQGASGIHSPVGGLQFASILRPC